MASLCGSSISSAVTMTGPIGAKVSKVLPMVHWLVAIWKSRALTSLRMVYPKTCSRQRASGMCRPPLPITTANSAS